MRRALFVSLLLHGLLIGALLIGLPNLGERLPEEQPITVDIVSDTKQAQPAPLPPKVPLAEAAPIPQRQAAAPSPPPPPPPAPPADKPPEVKPAPPPPPPPQVAEAKPEPQSPPPPAKPAPAPPPPPPKQAEPAPEPPKPAPPPPPPPPPPEPKKAEVPPPKPVPIVKPPPPEPPKARPEEKPKPPTPKTVADPLDAVLASVINQTRRVKDAEKRDGKGMSAERGGTNQPGPAQQAQVDPSALVAAIIRQVSPCWSIPVGVQDVGGMRAELNIRLGPDGSVQSVTPEPEAAARMAADPAFRTFAESAVRAVRACSPLKLPPESYQVWRNIIFNFDPSLLTG